MGSAHEGVTDALCNSRVLMKLGLLGNCCAFSAIPHTDLMGDWLGLSCEASPSAHCWWLAGVNMRGNMGDEGWVEGGLQLRDQPQLPPCSGQGPFNHECDEGYWMQALAIGMKQYGPGEKGARGGWSPPGQAGDHPPCPPSHLVATASTHDGGIA